MPACGCMWPGITTRVRPDPLPQVMSNTEFVQKYMHPEATYALELPCNHMHPETNLQPPQVTTVGADCCLKLLDARTASVAASFGPQGMWRDACRAVAGQYPKYDVLDRDGTTPAVTSSECCIIYHVPCSILMYSIRSPGVRGTLMCLQDTCLCAAVRACPCGKRLETIGWMQCMEPASCGSTRRLECALPTGTCCCSDAVAST